MQELVAVSVANFAFRACAALPFCSAKEEEPEPPDAGADGAGAGAAAGEDAAGCAAAVDEAAGEALGGAAGVDDPAEDLLTTNRISNYPQRCSYKQPNAPDTRVRGDGRQLRPVGNAALLVRGAALRRAHGRAHAERDRARLPDGDVADELRWVRALELALEEPVELRVLRRRLAVRHGQRRGLHAGANRISIRMDMNVVGEGAYGVARLLREELRELDHVRVALERLGEVDHRVGGVLLVARARGGEEGPECGHGRGVALFATAGGVLSGRTSER